jgi:NifU-like protein involved in Fe-S cluster formation
MSDVPRPPPYPPAIVRWARASERRGFVAPADGETVRAGEAINRTCGDRLSLQFHVHEAAGIVTRARFDGEGCALCIAAAAALCEVVEGQPSSLIPGVAATLRAVIDPSGSPPDPSFTDLHAFAAVGPFPQRHRCVTLPADAAEAAVATAQPAPAQTKDPR